MAHCAECTDKSCRFNGDYSKAPKDCPTLGVSHEETISRYDEIDTKGCRMSAAVEGRGYGRLTRVEEIMYYCHLMGYKKIGLAFCFGFNNEGRILSQILRDNGFEVESVCCKNGAVPKKEFGIKDEDQIKAGAYEVMCNPAGQAEVLNKAKVDISLILGLCVGHDTVFIKHINTPVTYVAVKDRATGHNPMAAIYCHEGYLKRVHTFIKDLK